MRQVWQCIIAAGVAGVACVCCTLALTPSPEDCTSEVEFEKGYGRAYEKMLDVCIENYEGAARTEERCMRQLTRCIGAEGK